MSKKIQLTIAEPCHENWDSMTPVEKGKFCGSCQKQVVDFSNMSDRQVAEFFKKPNQGRSKEDAVCGRFMTDQLDRDIEMPRKRIPWVKYFFQIALPAFLVSMKVSGQKTTGKIKMSTVAKDTTRRPVTDDLKMMGMVSRPQPIKTFMGDTTLIPAKDPRLTVKGEIGMKIDTLIEETVCPPVMGTIFIKPEDTIDIEGRVLDENNQAVPFARIETEKPGEGFSADEQGHFKIRKNWFGKGKFLVFSSTGFENKRIIAGEEEYVAGKLVVRLQPLVTLPEVIPQPGEQVTMGAVAMVLCEKDPAKPVAPKTDTVMARDLPFPPAERGLLFYPNPVFAGMLLTTSFSKLDEGFYQLQLVNYAGQSVRQQEIWVGTRSGLFTTSIPYVAAGSYFLILTHKKTRKRLFDKLVIQ